MFRLRRYVDGKLVHTSNPQVEKTQLLRWMDNYQTEWSQHLEDGHLPKMVGCNQGKVVDRISADELRVVTTEDRQLRFVIVERAK